MNPSKKIVQKMKESFIFLNLDFFVVDSGDCNSKENIPRRVIVNVNIVTDFMIYDLETLKTFNEYTFTYIRREIISEIREISSEL